MKYRYSTSSTAVYIEYRYLNNLSWKSNQCKPQNSVKLGEFQITESKTYNLFVSQNRDHIF